MLWATGSQRLTEAGPWVYNCRNTYVFVSTNSWLEFQQILAPSPRLPETPRCSHPEAPRGCQRLPKADMGWPMGLPAVGNHRLFNKLLGGVPINPTPPRPAPMLPEAPRGSQRLPEAPGGCQGLWPTGSQRLTEAGPWVYSCRRPYVFVSTNSWLEFQQILAPSPRLPETPRCSHPEAPRGCQRLPKADMGWLMGLQLSETIGCSTNSWVEFQ